MNDALLVECPGLAELPQLLPRPGEAMEGVGELEDVDAGISAQLRRRSSSGSASS